MILWMQPAIFLKYIGFQLTMEYPIIDNNPCKSRQKIEICPAALRYNERTAAERVNSELKDNYALETTRVKGHKKVACHIMFAVLALASKKIFNFISQKQNAYSFRIT